MSDFTRCRSCGNPVDPELAKAQDGACPWCLAAFTFGPGPAAESSTRFGKYVRTEKLGAGGMGEVWKAHDTELDRWVALKFLKDQDPLELARFQREARTAAGLSHPNIGSIYEIGEADGRSFIAMQYVAGQTLVTFPRDDRKLTLRLLRDAARAVDHAHRQGIIHRDLKPENLMVEKTGEDYRLVVLDFGLARPIEGGEKLSMSGDVVGTPAYMSPEQARGATLDERTDVYSLGATLYEVLTGKAPFEGPNVLEVIRKVGGEEPPRPRKLNPQIHRDLETIILKCLEKDRNRRYASAQELADDVDRFLNHDPIRARPPSTIYRLQMQLGKRKATVAAVAAVVGLIATAAVFIPKWLEETRARKNQEMQARESRERFERARPHLEAGQKALQRMRSRMREPYEPEVLKSLGAIARGEFGRALAQAPDHPEAHLGTAIAHSLAGEKHQAFECLGRAIAADGDFSPAYLERVRIMVYDYEERRHGRTGVHVAETAESEALRHQLESDLRMVERFSKEYPQQKYAQALQAFANGDYAKAAEELGRYLELEPEDGQARGRRGHALWHLGRHAEALEALDRALACDTGDPHALLLRGATKQALGDSPGAIADYTRVIALVPESELAYTNRGIARQSAGRHDEALADYAKAIELDPKSVESYLNRGYAKTARGLHDEALADYAKAIELNPAWALGYVNRGSSYMEMGRSADAIADFTKAIELDPKLPMAYANRGMARAAEGRVDEAIADFTRTVELNPGDWESFCNLGTARCAKGQLDEGIADFTKAIELNPTVPMAYGRRGLARQAKGLDDEAIADYGKAIELNPKDSIAYYNRGNVKLRMGLPDEAISDYDEVIKLDPKCAEAYANRGHMKARKGLNDEAVVDWSKALEVAPAGWPYRRSLQKRIEARGPAVLFGEANRLHESKKYEDAIVKFKRIVEGHPDSEEAVPSAYNIACGYALLGKTTEALDWLEKSVEMGWSDLAHLEKDSDLAPLRGEVRYRKLVDGLRAR